MHFSLMNGDLRRIAEAEDRGKTYIDTSFEVNVGEHDLSLR